MNWVRIAFLILLWSANSYGASDFNFAKIDSELGSIYIKAEQQGVLGLPLGQRVEYFSRLFLGRPYLGGALGEGAQAAFDNDPLYRFDAFDCTTFVETVISLSISRSAEQFPSVMNSIRYKDGVVGLFSRNHFTSADWIPNGERLHLLKDVTLDIGQNDSSELQTLIDKRTWYFKQASSMVLTPDNRDKKIQFIQSKAQGIPSQLVKLNYLSKELLVWKPDVMNRFPDAGVVSIVRKNWVVREAIGTDLDISHQGIIFRRNGEIIFRHASFKKGMQYVVEVPLLEYIGKNYNDKTFAGVNVLSLQGN